MLRLIHLAKTRSFLFQSFVQIHILQHLILSVITGQTVRSGGAVLPLTMTETLRSEFMLKLLSFRVLLLLLLEFKLEIHVFTYFTVAATVNSTKYFEMSSIPMQKFVQNVDIGTWRYYKSSIQDNCTRRLCMANYSTW